MRPPARRSTKGKARSLAIDECAAWLSQLEADPIAVRRDLPDLTRWLLATGVRIGEAIAVARENVDLDGESVQIDHKIIRVRGKACCACLGRSRRQVIAR